MRIYIVFKVFEFSKELYAIFLSKESAESFIATDCSIFKLVVESHWAN